jgi:hypothetical protein
LHTDCRNTHEIWSTTNRVIARLTKAAFRLIRNRFVDVNHDIGARRRRRSAATTTTAASANRPAEVDPGPASRRMAAEEVAVGDQAIAMVRLAAAGRFHDTLS